MSEHQAAFVGSIPENYDRYLGPCFFEPYALDIAKRIKDADPASVLETACGTGIVTRHLRETLRGNARLVATDLNQAMLEYAMAKKGALQGIEWKQADAMNLPFPNESFEAVVCQFGLMFFPDKAKALKEASRVLVRGGALVFNVWDSMEKNDLARIAHQTVSSFFEDNPPAFFETPYGFHDRNVLRDLVTEAGFRDVSLSDVSKAGISSSAMDAAKGAVEGTPLLVQLNERGMSDVSRVVDAVAKAVAQQCGDKPAHIGLQAIRCEARRA
ncbi:MAG TPA: methyltransferase domain-containing protein [Blastocatellia bacterium]|nr:methyltransferase domain-containing protein [Blastocatellia bacterium]